MFEQLATYRHLGTLNDGTRVLLRPLLAEDREALIELFAPTGADDLRYTRHDVTDREMVASWVDNLNYRAVFPLVAVLNEQIVGEATLHFKKGPARHIAEIRIFLPKDFRRRGLGTLMVKTLIEIARKLGLHKLVAEIVADQAQVIKAFRRIGFKLMCTFEDYYMMADGETHDVAVLFMELKGAREEF